MNYEEYALQNEQQLRQNSYPGRGIILGMTPDQMNYVQVYWIMGRSRNSQNRIFEAVGDAIRTKAFDEGKMEDPRLILYYPVQVYENYHIVGNGDQTDTILKYIKNGSTFENALNTREFEPDSPNYTPRVSGFIDLRTDKAHYGLSILKSINNNQELCQRSYYYYNNFIKGYGHCIHTYHEDGNPIPSFTGEPFIVKTHNKIEDTMEYYWNLLNEEYKISLLVKHINVLDKSTKVQIINKNHKCI